EQSGFEVKEFTAHVFYDTQHAQLRDLTFITDNTRIGHSIGITYPGINSLKTDIADVGIEAQFSNTVVAIDDILLFLPDYKNQNFFAANRGKTISLSGKISGKIKDVTASGLRAELTGGTSVALDAHIKGLPNALDAFY